MSAAAGRFRSAASDGGSYNVWPSLHVFSKCLSMAETPKKETIEVALKKAGGS
jgi:hypothetical protein